ncbi:hypothetical protein BH10PSE7_BH10PSE7_36710 [soil metagenome]
MADIVGTPGSDNRIGTNFSDTFSMNTGMDFMAPRRVEIGGLDFCDGGGGVDTLIVEAANETEAVTVGAGGPTTFIVDSVSGRYNIDAINTELLNFTGGSGNDTVNSDNGGHILDGNFGIDQWIANYSTLTERIFFRLAVDTFINPADLHIEHFEQMILTTGSGNDSIAGASRSDQIITNAGNDTIDAGGVEVGGLDKAFAGDGIDTLVVNATGELKAVLVAAGFSVSSESGRMNVETSSVEELRFSGGQGDDIVNSGQGGDRIDGNAGLDWWIADYSTRTERIEFNLGTTGDLRQVGLNFIADIERISLKTGSASDSIGGGAQSDDIDTGAGNDTVDTGTVQAGGLDRFFAGDGNDLLVVNAANEKKAVTVTRGAPNYFVSSESGHFTIEAYDVERLQFTGGIGSDTVFSGNGGERLEGGLGVDQWNGDYSSVNFDINFALGIDGSISFTRLKSIFGFERMNLKTGSGDDRITGGNRSDDLDTGKGNDTVDAKACGVGGLDRVFAGDGVDTLIVNARSETDSVVLSFGGPALYFVSSDSHNFTLEGYSTEKLQFTGGSGDDTINSGDGGVIIKGGGGTDFWQADLGAVNSAVKFILGDTLSIGAAGLKAISGIERISLITGNGSDTITGGNLSDQIETGKGNDVIDMGKVETGGLDRAFGGDGFDTLVVDAAAEAKSITVSVAGSPTFFITSESHRFNIEGFNIERVNVSGGSAGDVMTGGAAADIFDGNGGADTINGGLGADSLAGGFGADRFVYASTADSRASNSDRIIDFGATDRIDLSAIDAKESTGENDAFSFIGTTQFHSRAGELRYAGGRVFGDTDGDAIADIIIIVPSDTLLTRGDFVL